MIIKKKLYYLLADTYYCDLKTEKWIDSCGFLIPAVISVSPVSCIPLPVMIKGQWGILSSEAVPLDHMGSRNGGPHPHPGPTSSACALLLCWHSGHTGTFSEWSLFTLPPWTVLDCIAQCWLILLFLCILFASLLYLLLTWLLNPAYLVHLICILSLD